MELVLNTFGTSLSRDNEAFKNWPNYTKQVCKVPKWYQRPTVVGNRWKV